VVRAANTGISAVIGPSGRIVARLGIGIEGVLDARLPSALKPTVYARLGDIPVVVLLAVALLLVMRRRFTRRTA
jgi:apolipoprotein N-acyltransferase